MATPAASDVRLNGICRRLVAEQLLGAEQAQALQQQARERKLPLISLLVEEKAARPRDLANLLADEFGVPVLDLDAIDLAQAPRDEVDERLVRQHQVLPLKVRGNRLFVAISDPTNLAALDEVTFHTGKVTEGILVEHDKLLRAIDKLLETMDSSMRELADVELDLDIAEEEPEPAADDGEAGAEDAPVVRFINKVLLDAIRKGASDIHFEPYENTYRVRCRFDGILYEIAKPPVNLSARLAARIKVMSRLDIAERRVPQDGRIKLKLSANRAIDFRVSTCPTLFGEKIVMRILDPSTTRLGADALGFEPAAKALYLDTLSRPQGMVLVTGPTGSGKTVTLYTGLGILNTTDRNISTAEDPAEINLPGVNQVNVNPRVGLTFASAMRAFLRQDPDVIMVGEIRDLETAEIAIKAAQTGHMVLSTLHTNDAPQTLERLLNMGVAPFNIASSVSLIIAQRLARRLCAQCKQPIDVPLDALREEGFSETEARQVQPYGPVGCNSCTNGYRGRVGLYQVMPVTGEIGRIIMDHGNSRQIAAQARAEGVIDLRRAGLNKVAEGVTSLEEINRVTVE